MSVGFRARNASSNIQIDETYKNLALRAKGTVTASTVWNTTWRIATLTVSASLPVLAWRCAAPCAMVWASRSGGTVTYNFIVGQDANASIDWWLFDDPAFGSVVGSIGMRIKNEATGQLTYDSRMKYLRVIGTLNGSLQNGFPSGPIDYTGLPAIVTGNVPYVYTSQAVGAPGGPPPYPWVDFIAYAMAAASNQRITWSAPQSNATDHPASQPLNPASRQDAYNFLIADVSNF